MTDWTIVITAGIAALSGIVGSGLGYLAAVHQGKTATRQIEVELEKIELATEAERRQQRSELFEQLVGAMMEFQAFNGYLTPDLVAAGGEWNARVIALRARVAVVAGPGVRGWLESEMVAAIRAVQARPVDMETAMDRVRVAAAAMTSAMREDLALGRASLKPAAPPVPTPSAAPASPPGASAPADPAAPPG